MSVQSSELGPPFPPTEASVVLPLGPKWGGGGGGPIKTTWQWTLDRHPNTLCYISNSDDWTLDRHSDICSMLHIHVILYVHRHSFDTGPKDSLGYTVLTLILRSKVPTSTSTEPSCICLIHKACAHWDGILGHQFNKRLKSFARKPIPCSGFKNPYKKSPRNKKLKSIHE